MTFPVGSDIESSDDPTPSHWRTIRTDCHGCSGTSTSQLYRKQVCLGVVSTRYPEAIPLCTIDAATIAEELVKVFARVGVPKEVLTDQGSNFVSQLLAEVY